MPRGFPRQGAERLDDRGPALTEAARLDTHARKQQKWLLVDAGEPSPVSLPGFVRRAVHGECLQHPLTDVGGHASLVTRAEGRADLGDLLVEAVKPLDRVERPYDRRESHLGGRLVPGLISVFRHRADQVAGDRHSKSPNRDVGLAGPS